MTGLDQTVLRFRVFRVSRVEGLGWFRVFRVQGGFQGFKASGLCGLEGF